MTSDDFATVIVDAGLGTVAGANRTILVGSRANVPAGPGPYISLRDTGGSGPDRIQNKRTANFKYPAVQVIVRAEDPVAAYNLAVQVYNALIQVVNQEINGLFYLRIMPLQEPTDLGLDDTNLRTMWVFNAIATTRPS